MKVKVAVLTCLASSLVLAQANGAASGNRTSPNAEEGGIQILRLLYRDSPELLEEALRHYEEGKRIMKMDYEEYRAWLKSNGFCERMPGLAACQ